MAGYEIGDYKFQIGEFFPIELMEMITELRASGKAPEIIEKEAKSRKRRKKLTYDGMLTILASDHPARRVTSVMDDPVAMGDRQEYLGRVLRVITSPGFDGVMGTTDVIEDLLLVQHLLRKADGHAFLDDKVILGCMNRGGLSGAVFEMDDRMTSFTAERIHKLGLDAAKLMFRICDDDVHSVDTIEYCAKAITELNRYNLYSFLEVLAVEKVDGKFKVKKEADALIKAVGVAAALGDSSARIWLKIPYCDGYERVARATTAPILMLGGESKGDPTPLMEQFHMGLNAGGNVRGALVGRNILFPGMDDPRAVAMAVSEIVHEGIKAEEAIKIMNENRGRDIDALTKYFS
ncbi:MAG: hypothetical protein AB1546_06550 [bacterium]